MIETKSEIIRLRASDSERATWEASAEAAGLKLSAWLRRAANNASQLESVLDKEKSPMRPFPGDDKPPPSLKTVKDLMYPQKRKRCIHRLMPNTFCKQCGVTK
jgi:hypothetical protein